MRVETAKAEIAHRTDRTQFRVGGKVSIPFVLAWLAKHS